VAVLRVRRDDVRLAGAIVPVRRVVAQDAEIRSPHELEVVREARMCHREVPIRGVCRTRIRVRERRVRVSDDLSVRMILHDDQEPMLETGNSTVWLILTRSRGCDQGSRHAAGHDPFTMCHHEHLLKSGDDISGCAYPHRVVEATVRSRTWCVRTTEAAVL